MAGADDLAGGRLIPQGFGKDPARPSGHAGPGFFTTESSMLILAARCEAPTSLSEACHEAVDLCNRLQVGIDMTFDGDVIEVRPGNHPFNLVQIHQRKTAGRPSSGPGTESG
jgi:hypothetical protein